jgi:lipid-A-disaccharide synthase
MGLWEVLPRLPELLWIRHRLASRLQSWRPELLVTCDAPDFNLPLARIARRHGIPVVHIASPSVWAWRQDRIPTIAASLDALLCLFPFEPALYESTQLSTTFIGHPFATHIAFNPDTHGARVALNLPTEGRILACLPGSRATEVRALWPTFLEGLKALKAVIPELRVVIPIATRDLATLVNPGELSDWILCVDGRAQTVLAAANAALVASGTASLEAILTGRPTVVAYHMHPRTYRRVMAQLLTPWVSLPNQLAGQLWIPELIQDELTASSIVTHLAPRLLDGPDAAFLATARSIHDVLTSVPRDVAVTAIEETLRRAHRH